MDAARSVIGGVIRTWEYKIIDSHDVPREGTLRGRSREALEDYVNQLGAEGWEVVNIDALELESRMNFLGIAKRERSPEPEAA